MGTPAAHPGSSQRGVVDLAAKLARIVWAVLRHGRAFEYQAHAVSIAPETHMRSVEDEKHEPWLHRGRHLRLGPLADDVHQCARGDRSAMPIPNFDTKVEDCHLVTARASAAFADMTRHGAYIKPPDGMPSLGDQRCGMAFDCMATSSM